MAVCAGQFKDDLKEELAYVALFNTGSTAFVYNLILEASPDLQQINFDFNKRLVRSFQIPLQA